MGIHGRDRRRQKKRREEAAARARERRRAEPGGDVTADDVERLLATAVAAQRRGDGDETLDLAELLAAGPPGPGGRALADAVVVRRVRSEVTSLCERGWTPTDLERVVRRKAGKTQAGVLTAAADAPAGAFLDRVCTDRVSAVLWVLEALVLLDWLPPLPKVRSAEHTRRLEVDGRMLERVRALLAKAESTTFPEEAEALSAKAQELMARYAIDRALLDATLSGAAGDGASGRRLGIDDPYASPKSLLLSVVADANRCRAVWTADFGFSTVFGADDDLDIVEMLFTSLLCQATAAMTAAGSTTAGPMARRARSRSFRQSFLVAYASRIGARLREATAAATGEASAVHGAERLLPVLAARSEAAEEAAHAAFPHVRRSGVSAHDGAGWAAGTAAADLASLHTHREVRGTAG